MEWRLSFSNPRIDVERWIPLLLTDRLHAWRRAQIDYYADASRHGREYPPIPAMLAD